MRYLVFTFTALTLGTVLHAVSPEDWPTYNHDVLGWRYNAAEKTLSPGNVSGLVEKWRAPSVLSNSFPSKRDIA